MGRAVDCDLVVNDGSVSRRHLMLEPSPDGWTAIDISANGTWHAGERVQRLRISGECQLRLGAVDGPEITISPVEPRPEAGGTDRHWERKTYLARDGSAAGPMLPDDHPTADSDEPRTHELRLGRISIGRALSNDIVVGDLMASREHAELLVGRGGVEIVDLGRPTGPSSTASGSCGRCSIAATWSGSGTTSSPSATASSSSTSTPATWRSRSDAISVDAGKIRLLHEMTFRLPGRALLAVLGPSGAGKSTLLNALTGFRPADQGTVLLRRPRPLPRVRRAARNASATCRRTTSCTPS